MWQGRGQRACPVGAWDCALKWVGLDDVGGPGDANRAGLEVGGFGYSGQGCVLKWAGLSAVDRTECWKWVVLGNEGREVI